MESETRAFDVVGGSPRGEGKLVVSPARGGGGGRPINLLPVQIMPLFPSHPEKLAAAVGGGRPKRRKE